jgi:hypothetical protein
MSEFIGAPRTGFLDNTGSTLGRDRRGPPISQPSPTALPDFWIAVILALVIAGCTLFAMASQ